MGRSPYFKYEKVQLLDKNVPSNVLDVLSNLKTGDKFIIKNMEGFMKWCPIYQQDIPPLNRSPSTYGYEEMPLRENLYYIVLNDNDEPNLENIKGIRSIKFLPTKNQELYHSTYRMCTDGTIRECEALGIINIIRNITIVVNN